jgi:hypothetical protein
LADNPKDPLRDAIDAIEVRRARGVTLTRHRSSVTVLLRDSNSTCVLVARHRPVPIFSWSAMTISTISRWHELVRSRDAKGLDTLLADNVVFYSPVVHTPQAGKAVTVQYLSAAFQVFFDESFRYVRELTGSNDAVLEFQVEIDGILVNGVDLLKWDHEGKIVEFKVMIRPLKAINLIHQKMAAILQAKT